MELFFSRLFTDYNLTPIVFFTGVCVAILSYGRVTKISLGDGLLSEPTKEVFIFQRLIC